MTPTETLRAAADKLRELANAATPGPWEADEGTMFGDVVTAPAPPQDGEDMFQFVFAGKFYGPSDAALISALDPVAASLLADAINYAAKTFETMPAWHWETPGHPMLHLARHVLGEVS